MTQGNSQVLSRLYEGVRQGELTKKEADGQLAYLRGLRIRLLGDSALQSRAWKIADQLRWPNTFDAEYVALTQLQADAFITLDANLAQIVTGLVTIAPIDALSCQAPRHPDGSPWANPPPALALRIDRNSWQPAVVGRVMVRTDPKVVPRFGKYPSQPAEFPAAVDPEQ